MSIAEAAIIGAGNGGRAFAVYLSNRGVRVNLCYRTLDNLLAIQRSMEIVSRGAIEGTFPVNTVTNDYAEAVKYADLILVVTPACAHDSILEAIIPHMHDGQILLLNPGRTWGAINAYNKINETRPELECFVGETQSLLFTCRKMEDWGVDIIKIKEEMKYCFYPGRENAYLDHELNAIFPQFVPAGNILCTSLENIGMVLHPACMVLNAGSIERKTPFLFYREGMSDSVVKVVEGIDRERCLIMERLGLEASTFLDWARDVYGCYAGSYKEAFTEIDCYENIGSPDTLLARYITEEVPTGLVPLASLGQYFNIPTPHVDAIITLAGTMTGMDFWGIGRNIESVGVPTELLETASDEETFDSLMEESWFF